MRLYFDGCGVVRMASTTPVHTNLYRCVEVADPGPDPVGKKVVFGRKPSGGMRLAVICNWGDECGIATYTGYLLGALRPLVGDLKIFAECGKSGADDLSPGVNYCWRRGQPMRDAIRQVLAWRPTAVLIQHEYGIFPRTSYLLQMLEMLEDTPYAVTLHSIYEHLDKTVASGSMKNIIVHTTQGKDCLRGLGNRNRIDVIPHGCVPPDGGGELWNTWQTPHPIVQFGFGFEYKGVDVALEAIARLKADHGGRYKDIFYTYFCSENRHVRNVHDAYVRALRGQIAGLGLQDNAAIIRGFQSEDVLRNTLRTSRLALFPYVTDPKNVVYGASGAVRLAMASGVPVIASSSHMFDDLEGVLPRPDGPRALAEAIDRAFGDAAFRRAMLDRAASYLREHSWAATARRYLAVLDELATVDDRAVIYVGGDHDDGDLGLQLRGGRAGQSGGGGLPGSVPGARPPRP